MKKIDTGELYTMLVCALSHNLDTCRTCKKCFNGDRIEMVRAVANYLDKPLPWKEEGDNKD